MTTLRIALVGLQPGSTTLEIGTAGLLHIPVPPSPEDEEQDGGFLIPVYFRPPPRERVDCKIQVEGVTARLSATSENIAAAMPTTEDRDLEDDIAWLKHTRRMEAEAAEDREEEIRFLVWEHFEEIREAEKIKAEEARAFRKNVASIARGLRKGRKIDVVGVSAAIVGLGQENFELRQRLEALEAVQTPKPAPRPKAKK